MIKVYSQNSRLKNVQSRLAKNSLDLSDGLHFLKSVNGIIDKAAANDRIIWVSNSVEAYASDNETGAKKEVNYMERESGVEYEVSIDWGTITAADEWKFYDLKTSNSVDGTTENAAPSGKEVEMIKFISATKGIFRIVL